MKVLSLDLATKTGWALWDGARIESGVQDFSKQRGESNGMLFLKFNRWLDALSGPESTVTISNLPWEKPISHHDRFDLIVFEQAHHRGGAATEIAVGLMTRVLEFCARYGIEHAPVHSMTLKKWATGSGKADKAAMIAVANKFYRQAPMRPITDDNESDAVLLLGYALEKFGGENPCNARPAAAAVPGSMQQSQPAK